MQYILSVIIYQMGALLPALLLLALPVLFSYPFLDRNGPARFAAFAEVGLPPILIALYLAKGAAPLLFVIGWLVLCWNVAMWDKIATDKAEKKDSKP